MLSRAVEGAQLASHLCIQVSDGEVTVANHLPKPSRRFSFRLVYILRPTKTAASAGVPAITARHAC